MKTITDENHWKVYALVDKQVWKDYSGLRLEQHRTDEIVENALIEATKKEIGERKNGNKKQY